MQLQFDLCQCKMRSKVAIIMSTTHIRTDLQGHSGSRPVKDTMKSDILNIQIWMI